MQGGGGFFVGEAIGGKQRGKDYYGRLCGAVSELNSDAIDKENADWQSAENEEGTPR